MARQAKNVQTKTLEQRLWETADALRGNQEPSEYKHVVLGLVFLKYISDRFEARRKDVETALSDPNSSDYIPNEARRLQFIEDRDEYASHNVFWVPAEARWESVQAQAKLPEIGQGKPPRLPWRELVTERSRNGSLTPSAAQGLSAL
jgi:type I restriction enzyme M protein